jgi:hypothetical protein
LRGNCQDERIDPFNPLSLAALENKYDAQFKVVFDAIKQLMAPPEPKRRKIGFRRENEWEDNRNTYIQGVGG